jgi:tetratricopeptide (TPR) repeat protein
MGYVMSISDHDLRAAVTRAVQAPRFATSPRLSRLLKFLVDEAIAGRGAALKGYTIGLEVFDKRDDFDPSQDPIVRVQMGRLRQALELYYHNEGATDPIRIMLIKGSYLPTFELTEQTADGATALQQPTDRGLNPVPVAAGAETITQALGAMAAASPKPTVSMVEAARAPAWLPHVTVIAALGLIASIAFMSTTFVPRPTGPAMITLLQTPSPSAQWRPKIRVYAEAAPGSAALIFKTDLLGGLATYTILDTVAAEHAEPSSDELDRSAVFTLTIQAKAQDTEATVRLTDNIQKRVVWASSETGNDLATKDGRQRATEKLIRLLLQQRGVLFTYLATRSNLDPRLTCLVRSGLVISFRDAEPEAISKAKRCLADMIASEVAVPLAQAFYANLHLPPFDHKTTPDHALRLAHDALVAGPRNSIAHRSMMAAYWNSGQIEPALQMGARAVAANPLNADVAAAYGFRLVTSGAYRDGLTILSAAMRDLLPGDTCWELGLFLGYLGLGEDAMAASIGARLPRGDRADLTAARVVALKLLGRHDEAREDLKQLTTRLPKLAPAPQTAFSSLRLHGPLNDRLRMILASVR